VQNTQAICKADARKSFRLQAANPHPKTELEYRTPFRLLVAVMLSAQATDVSVNHATRQLFPVANTPQALLALGEERLSAYIQRIGLYKTKARHVMQTCRLLVERHGGAVPETREELEALPGVGRKTANVILNAASRHRSGHACPASRTELACPPNAEVETECSKSAGKIQAHQLLICTALYLPAQTEVAVPSTTCANTKIRNLMVNHVRQRARFNRVAPGRELPRWKTSPPSSSTSIPNITRCLTTRNAIRTRTTPRTATCLTLSCT
jgi:hypothetical protein